MGDHAVLRRVAVETGLDPARVDEVLASDEYADAVEADIAQARAYGAGGVPFYVVDQRYGVSGAQPAEVFAQLPGARLGGQPPGPRGRRRRADAHACGPDGCAI